MLEILNEATIFLVCSVSILLTKLNRNFNTKNIAGKFIVVIFVAILILNLLFIFFEKVLAKI